MRKLCPGAAVVALTIVLTVGASVAGAAGATITVTHELYAARPSAVVAVPFAQIAAVAPDLRMYHVVVRDPKGRSLPLQITNYQHDHRGVQYDDLVFSYDFAAGEKRAVFTLEPVAVATAPEAPCVYARFIPERFDDMAWENDRIAHRMYGFTLNTPAATFERLRGSGIDVWAKRVTYPIVDRWYAKGHDQFHKDEEGEGLDLYSIGGSRGAGGTGVWDGTRLWTSDNFLTAQVLANGPRRAAFRLNYTAWEAGSSDKVAETKQFTVDCGQNFDAVESVFDFVPNEAVVGIGISEHPAAAGFPAAVLTRDPGGRWMSFWEDNKDGGLGIAVVLANDVTPAGFAHEDAPGGKGNANNLLLVKAKDGVPLRYFTGAGWTKSGQYADRAAWEQYVKDFAAQVQKPLSIAVSARP
jgi:pectinesterase